ncbi:N-acetylmuramoyl-L-alanine amidase isoform X2 [Pezoporus occidentalis]|uniref:N-acetylmuramoyl-L-alanine amidase isoform X2 n=1 Tax=Pezoporus occidentalis TaxID=407982 RepID=UPI002F91709A
MVLSLLLVLSVGARPGTGLPPRHMDSVLELMEALDADSPNRTLPELARALGACSTPGCRAVLGEPPPVPPGLSQHQWVLLRQLLHRDAVVLAPDGSTVALGPLLAGIEVGQKRGSGWPFPTFEPPIDPLYAVTITEALGTSFLLARGGDGATLGPGGCWDDVDDPQNYTLLGPPSPIPDAVANGAMDGVLLGARVAQAPIPLADLLRDYYGMGNTTEQGRARSSYRRRDFGVLMGQEKLEQEVEAMLRVLRVLPATKELLQDVGPEEVAAIAERAARDFTQLYVAPRATASSPAPAPCAPCSASTRTRVAGTTLDTASWWAPTGTCTKAEDGIGSVPTPKATTAKDTVWVTLETSQAPYLTRTPLPW